MAIKIPNHKTGTHWPGIAFEVLHDGDPKSLVDATIKVAFKQNASLVNADLVLSTTDDTITITDAAAGQFKLGPVDPEEAFPITLPPGTYYFDILIKYDNGQVYCISDGTWEITRTVTVLK
jgi:hypothetical protein